LSFLHIYTRRGFRGAGLLMDVDLLDFMVLYVITSGRSYERAAFYSLLPRSAAPFSSLA
jgi:hypothetical protein